MSTSARVPFNIKLSAEEKAGLEALRFDMGLRSHAEAIRVLIAETDVANIDGIVSWRGSLPPNRVATPYPRYETKFIVRGEAYARAFGETKILDIAAIHADHAAKIANEPERLGPALQFGPTKRKPGEGLKKR